MVLTWDDSLDVPNEVEVGLSRVAAHFIEERHRTLEDSLRDFTAPQRQLLRRFRGEEEKQKRRLTRAASPSGPRCCRSGREGGSGYRCSLAPRSGAKPGNASAQSGSNASVS